MGSGTEAEAMGRKAWAEQFEAALRASATKAGVELGELQWEYATTDSTWGDRVGLVFWGASPEVAKRAAEFFEKWASKHLRKLGVVGSYACQESIGYEGEFYFSRYSNGARGWHRVRGAKDLPVEGSITKYPPAEWCPEGWELKCEEVRMGYATSYVYYPCSD